MNATCYAALKASLSTRAVCPVGRKLGTEQELSNSRVTVTLLPSYALSLWWFEWLSCVENRLGFFSVYWAPKMKRMQTGTSQMLFQFWILNELSFAWLGVMTSERENNISLVRCVAHICESPFLFSACRFFQGQDSGSESQLNTSSLKEALERFDHSRSPSTSSRSSRKSSSHVSDNTCTCKEKENCKHSFSSV